ncbi:MAG: CPBP family intramembrane glutamic endopeptidase [Steroidobacteraceae bacterium]
MPVRGCLRRSVTVPPDAMRGWLVRLMFDAHGVRAVVRAVLFIVLVGVMALLVTLMIRGIVESVPLWYRRLQAIVHQGRTGAIPVSLIALNESVFLVSALFATWVMSWLEGRPMSDIGFKRPNRWRDLTGGFLVGFGMLSVLVGALVALGFARLQAPTVGHGTALGYALAWLAAMLLVGCFEESAFRGYLLTVLRERYGFWPAALAVTVLFMAAHGLNVGENPTGLATVAVVSVLFCLAIRRTGALWWVIGCHAAWDWAESYFFGSADSGERSVGHLLTLRPLGNIYLSGGRDGPEGSVLCLAVLFLAIAALPLLIRHRGTAAAPAVAEA